MALLQVNSHGADGAGLSIGDDRRAGTDCRPHRAPVASGGTPKQCQRHPQTTERRAGRIGTGRPHADERNERSGRLSVPSCVTTGTLPRPGSPRFPRPFRSSATPLAPSRPPLEESHSGPERCVLVPSASRPASEACLSGSTEHSSLEARSRLASRLAPASRAGRRTPS